MHIEVVIPAAGRSRRMGRPKMLLPLGGKTVIEHTVGSMLAGRVNKVWVVTGEHNDTLSRLFHANGQISCLVNTTKDGDMLSSIRCGLAEVSKNCRGIILLPGDMPLISRELVDLLISRFAAQPETLTLPLCRGHRGHPIILPSQLRETVMNSFDGQGLRGVLELYPERIQEVEVDDDSIFLDMDTPENYDFIRTRMGHHILA